MYSRLHASRLVTQPIIYILYHHEHSKDRKPEDSINLERPDLSMKQVRSVFLAKGWLFP